MNLHNDTFTERQRMKTKDFECFHYKDNMPLNIPFHEHDFYEIYFFISGNASYIIEGKMYQLQAGDILLTDNKDIHKPVINSGKPYERYIIWIQPEFLHQISFSDIDLVQCFRHSSENNYKLVRPDVLSVSHLKQIFEKMARAEMSNELGNRTLSRIYLTEFLVYLNRAYFSAPEDISKDITENDKINEIVSYINENYSKQLTLEDFCKRFYISKSHLTSLFKQYTGLSLYKFIVKKRLNAARNMLRQNVPVMQACFECGFTDYSNFLKAFKREFSQNPREIRRVL